ncbi:flagellar protein FlgJ [Parvularcula bermudensis HTCC2503]|uniref:Flagellar protein FlgJ n=1 Tax=Parvularcula bermudensis (strain ATCC BAA-594 / HTCC2503 / KCTC 12087) TaxID=314260 RepID=E0TH56_PARBH|nr:flagellar protein FlgJ [Parvularcula bermudensis]ADM09640.1 flagellar protein FlgJ [Parvularcula bermudensis HTCC2503]
MVSLPSAFPLPALGAAATASDRLGEETVSDREARLRETAKSFEAVFVAEMLKHAGLDEALAADEGTATDSFSSFVIERVAGDLVEAGGFGLADRFYTALRAKEEPTVSTSL